MDLREETVRIVQTTVGRDSSKPENLGKHKGVVVKVGTECAGVDELEGLHCETSLGHGGQTLACWQHMHYFVRNVTFQGLIFIIINTLFIKTRKPNPSEFNQYGFFPLILSIIERPNKLSFIVRGERP